MIPLYKPFMPELPELDRILHSGALAYGEYTKHFEEELRSFFGVKNLMVTNSFHSAISVIITTLGLTFNDEVIASPMACLASTQPYASSGLKIKWADVDRKRGTLDPESVKSRVSKNTKAIIHNHFCGYPGYIDEINDIGSKYGIPVIDDGIECFGSIYKEKKIGNCGTDITVFSLTAVRIPNVIDGGVIIFKDDNLYKKALLIRDCGIDRSRFRDELGEINPQCDINLIGYSATMSNVNGYIGIQQMKYIPEILKKQKNQALAWNEYLKDSEYELIQASDIIPNYWAYGILADDKMKAIKQFRDIGFYASGVHINNNIYSVFGEYERLSNTEDFYNHFVALPCGWWVNQNV